MALHRKGSVQALLQHRNETRRAVELYLYENYPIDCDEKSVALERLARTAAEAECQLRRG